jgi:hypothetical protein
MGYRHYFYKVKKADVETIKDMDYEQLKKYVTERGREFVDDENYVNFDDVISQTEVHEFGKLYWDNTAKRIYDKGTPLFSKKETQDAFDDYNPYIVGKEGLLEAISIYQEKVLNYYKGLLVDGEERQLLFGITLTVEDVKSMDKVLEHLSDKISRISYCGIANIDEDSKWQVTSSWEYEHSIFNLVHILKSIDWQEDTILFYGW